MRNQYRWLVPSGGLPLFLVLISLLARSATAADARPLFEPPVELCPGDDIWLISTRGIGTKCSEGDMQRGLDCRLLAEKSARRASWVPANWSELTRSAISRPTIVYVHGNRVASGYDRIEGLQIYRSFAKHRPSRRPVRFIIWSWPAEQIPGPIKDYLVKAKRTNPAAWQLAWFLDKLPRDNPISMVGYSYGTRVVCGASHILAGGSIGPLKLTNTSSQQPPRLRAALMAAAFDADWLQPGELYSRSVSTLENVVLATNRLDPAMRFYHLSNGPGRMDALGKFGLYSPQRLGHSLSRVQRIDYTDVVGRSHVVEDYLAASRQMRALWRTLTAVPLTPSAVATACSRPVTPSY